MGAHPHPSLSTPPHWPHLLHLHLLHLLRLHHHHLHQQPRSTLAQATATLHPPTHCSSHCGPVGRGPNQNPKLVRLFLSDSHPQLCQTAHFPRLPLVETHSERSPERSPDNKSLLETRGRQTTSGKIRDQP